VAVRQRKARLTINFKEAVKLSRTGLMALAWLRPVTDRAGSRPLYIRPYKEPQGGLLNFG